MKTQEMKTFLALVVVIAMLLGSCAFAQGNADQSSKVGYKMELGQGNYGFLGDLVFNTVFKKYSQLTFEQSRNADNHELTVRLRNGQMILFLDRLSQDRWQIDGDKCDANMREFCQKLYEVFEFLYNPSLKPGDQRMFFEQKIHSVTANDLERAQGNAHKMAEWQKYMVLLLTAASEQNLDLKGEHIPVIKVQGIYFNPDAVPALADAISCYKIEIDPQLGETKKTEAESRYRLRHNMSFDMYVATAGSYKGSIVSADVKVRKDDSNNFREIRLQLK